MTDIIKRYDSVDELLTAAAAKHSWYRSGEGAFMGFRTFTEACEYVRNGAPPHEMREALALMEKVDSAMHDRETQTWTPSVAGAYPIVGDYLIGLPEHMRQRMPQESDAAPVKVVVEAVISAQVTQSQLVRRGAAIAALVQRMSEERPTELHVCAGIYDRKVSTNTYYITKLATNPINLAQCVAVMASKDFARRINFSWMQVTSGSTGSGGIRWAGVEGRGREHHLRRVFDLAPQDIIIPGGHVMDAVVMERDPVQWVHMQLEKQRTLDEG